MIAQAPVRAYTRTADLVLRIYLKSLSLDGRG